MRFGSGWVPVLSAVLMVTVSPAALAQAQPRATEADELAEGHSIVVTGTATPVALGKIGNSLTVIDGDAVERRGTAYLQDALREVPGVSVNQGGSFGSLSQVRIRGGEGNHVLVLVDGIEVSATGSGEFDFSSLLANNIDRVEILRGPQSGLYGSNALAGVINVITRGGDGPAFDAGAEYGSFDSRLARAAATVGTRETFLTASAAVRETNGISSAASGTEPDGDRNVTLYLRGGARLLDAARIDGSLRYVDKRGDTDGFDFSGGPFQGQAIDDDSYVANRDWSGGLALTLDLAEGWQTVLTASRFEGDASGGLGGVKTSGSRGDRTNLAARTTYTFDTPSVADASHSLTGFVEHEEEGYRNTLPSDPSQAARLERRLLGYGAEYRLDLFRSLYLRAAVRHDENGDFADATTFSLSGSWVLNNTRLHASYGTGVTNPTFFEQFGFVPGTFVGNPAVTPEKARGFDIGVEQHLFDGRMLVDLTYFNSTLEDEIISLFPSVENDRGKSRREGVEASARVDIGAVAINGTYTYLDARDPDNTREVRRPKHQASLDVTGNFGADDRGSFSAGLIYNGDVLDNDFRDYFNNGFVAEKSRLDAYSLFRVSVSYKVTEAMEVYGRAENLFDTQYQQSISYAAPGRGVFAGVRFVLP